ncbi:MAG TPA: hypothetical protein VGK39_03105 [Cyclobacteriaceae bacterium]
MELDELKSAWTQYDKKLSRSLELNEALLRKLNVDRSRLELKKPALAEIVGAVSMFYMTVFFMVLADRFIGELQYAIPAFISIGVALVYFTFAMIKLFRMVNISYYGAPVTVIQQQTAAVHRLILKLRKWELMLSPLILISLPPIFKFIHHVDLFKNWQTFFFVGVVCLLIGLPSTFLINKYLYDKKFQNVEKLLKEIEEYRLES